MRQDAPKRVKRRERKKKRAVELVKQEWIRLGNIRRYAG